MKEGIGNLHNITTGVQKIIKRPDYAKLVCGKIMEALRGPF